MDNAGKAQGLPMLRGSVAEGIVCNDYAGIEACLANGWD
jgi:hypothetical protein